MSRDQRGEGTLIVGDQEYPVSYGFTMGVRSGHGQISGSDKGLFEAMTSNSAVLVTKDGKRLDISVNLHAGGAGVAEFVLTTTRA